jgi:molybdopterin biosynthesis enzyme
VLRNRGSGNVYTALTESIVVPALEAGYVGKKFERPVLMLPGNVVSAQVTGITGLPGQPISAAIWYASLGI